MYQHRLPEDLTSDRLPGQVGKMEQTEVAVTAGLGGTEETKAIPGQPPEHAWESEKEAGLDPAAKQGGLATATQRRNGSRAVITEFLIRTCPARPPCPRRALTSSRGAL